MAYLGGKRRNGVENMDWPGLGQRPIFRAKSRESATLMVLQRRLECRIDTASGFMIHPVICHFYVYAHTRGSGVVSIERKDHGPLTNNSRKGAGDPREDRSSGAMFLGQTSRF